MPDRISEKELEVLLEEYRTLQNRLLMYAGRSFKVIGGFAAAALGLLGYAFTKNSDLGMASALALLLINGALFSAMHSHLIQLSLRRTIRWIARRINREGIAPLLVWEEFIWTKYYGQRKGGVLYEGNNLVADPSTSNWSGIMAVTLISFALLIGIAEIALWLSALPFVSGLVGQHKWLLWVTVVLSALAYFGQIYAMYRGIRRADLTTEGLPSADDHKIELASTAIVAEDALRVSTTTTKTTTETKTETTTPGTE